LLVALGIAAQAGAARHIVFKANGGPAQVRPQTIYASPTNGPFAKRLSWAGWGRARASAEGTVYYDTCEPNCSEGYHSTSGEVVLSGVHRCGRQLRYSLLHIVYFRAPQYNLRASYNCNGTPTHVHIGR
jgi:protocatechuate 3,4-dioxygenase beta subunit